MLARYPDVLVIEDDHFSMTSARPYHRITPPTTRRWVLIRSVAKFLGPDLRLAVARADPETASAMRARLHDGKTWVSHLLQTAAAHLLTDPEATSLVAAAREAYQQRLRTLTAELSAYSITPLGTPDGLNIWIDLPAAVDPHATCADVAAAGWAVQLGHLYAVEGMPLRAGIRVTSASLERFDAARFSQSLSRAVTRK